MKKASMAGCALALALVLLACTGSQAATMCAPGTGLKNFDFFGFLGGIVGGSSNTGSATCKPCGAWEASKGGLDAKCELCVPLLSAPNSQQTSCECLPGAYVSAETSSTSVQRACTSCGPNAVSTTRNAASCVACPAGAIAGKNNLCSCPTGFKATGINIFGVTGCTKCAEGTVSPGGLSDTCSTCTGGTIPMEAGDFCGCQPGTRMETRLAADGEPIKCTACQSVFEYTSESNRLMMCKQCQPFSYANAEHTACECSGGYYAENPAVQPVRCRRCPSGTYKAEAGNGGLDACIACPAGLEPSGSAKSCVAPLCPPGTQAKADGSCELCDEHSFNYRRGGTCSPCTDNTMASPDRTKCDACITGYTQTSDSGEDLKCNGCMPGLAWNTVTSKCDEDLEHAKQVAALNAQPNDEAWKAYQPQQFMAPAKKIATNNPDKPASKSGGSLSLPGRFGTTEDPIQTDDQYVYENKDKIAQANKLAAEGLARGEKFEDIVAELEKNA